MKRALPFLTLLLAVCLGCPTAEAQQSRLSPAAVHGFAEEAAVVRDLLRLEDTLTDDALALRPSRARIAARIREGNAVLIDLCSAIIRDDARIRRAERELRRGHASQAGIDPTQLEGMVSAATADVAKKLELLKAKGEAISIADMFEMQMLMNRLSQLSEMSTSVLSASNAAISSMARNVKS